MKLSSQPRGYMFETAAEAFVGQRQPMNPSKGKRKQMTKAAYAQRFVEVEESPS
ncbi:Uu.00g008350.m01.CDS01 [Anthostomella pinea]|uniref:Uu.00g008350.m01.CDS01 n=1 Tax=Anthostomella pinea TaxID=933095 RepID=A0AAI8VRF6_9PEZI|nr:Uu.00g008350.m01.CDS01 [Anthostomella pinea]